MIDVFYGKCYLVVVWHPSTYKIVKVIKLSKKLRQRILGQLAKKKKKKKDKGSTDVGVTRRLDLRPIET